MAVFATPHSGMWLQKWLHALTLCGNAGMRDAAVHDGAVHHGVLALGRTKLALVLRHDPDVVRAVAAFAQGNADAG